MEAKEGMTSGGGHEISPADNASINSRDDRPRTEECWIEMMLKKINLKVSTDRQPQPQPQPQHFDYEGEAKIFNFTLDGNYSQPKVVPIGPFHRVEGLPIVDEDKRSIVNLMKSLYGLDLEGCLKKMKNHIKVARDCYSDLDKYEGFDYKNNNDVIFIEMLMLDGFFILFMLTVSDLYDIMKEQISRDREKFILFSNMNGVGSTNRVGNIIPHKDEIMLDFLILDNQIPFFVIEELYKELKLAKPLHKYALEFFETIHPRSTRGRKDQNSPSKFLHLLDLFHWSRVPKDKYVVKDNSWHNRLDSINRSRYSPTATELRKSATMFQKKRFGSSLDITFRRSRPIFVIGKLNIPTLHIHDYSSFIFHNLIAFEMQTQSRGRCTMAFSAFMRNLLQSEEDVKLLRRCGILVNTSMTGSELINFFICLSRLTENYQMPSDLYAVYDQVVSHHNSRISQFCGNAILQYFPNPLMIFSVFAAFMLFVLTLLQTIYTVLGYYYHN